MTAPKILLITGPAGSGKTTLARKLCVRPGFQRWPSWTTRPPRPGEVAGFDYEFVTAAQFKAAVAAEKLVEHIEGPGGAGYGLPIPPPDLDVCLVAIVSRDVCDRAGEVFREFDVEVRELDAPDDVLIERMRRRGDDVAAINSRASLFDRERAGDEKR